MKELNRIKKIYGEEMMRLCRELFPRILEKEGLLLSILERNLAPTHSFASDIREKELEEEFKNWIYSFINVEEEKEKTTNKSPFELMDEAGYTLYECKNEEDIQGFRKYYKEDEVLCTIYNGGRLNRCHVFFAVKRNVDKIKREDFTKPRREDEYGTSVISIQFSRRSNTLSIKNRYNHTVNNPDATFSNNLENIIPGLTDSFEKYMGFKIKQQTRRKSDFLTRSLPYTRGNDGKYYRYNLEIDGVYYCENNIVIEHGRVILEYTQNKERYILIEQFLIDRKEKRIVRLSRDKESFTESIYSIGEIKSIDSIKDGKNKTIIINYIDGKQVKIEVDKNNAIIGYENNFIAEIDDYFLYYNKKLSNISLPNAKRIGHFSLQHNKSLRSIHLPNVKEIGNRFLHCNRQLSNISLPKVKEIGNHFLYYNEQLSDISLPNVRIIGDCFLGDNRCLNSISLPNVEIIGSYFLFHKTQLSSISLPNVEEIGDDFLRYNNQLSSVSLPNVREIGSGFLYYNECLRSIILPSVEIIGSDFLYSNEQINDISLPNIERIGANFLENNTCLKSIILPRVKEIGSSFLYYNECLRSITLPNVREIGSGFLYHNECLRSISLPNTEIIGDWFLYSNHSLSSITLPSIKKIGYGFLKFNPHLDSIKLEIERTRNEKGNNKRNK